MQPHVETQIHSLLASCRKLYALVEKQEDARQKLAKLTKDVKSQMDAVESDFRVVDAFLEDPVPGEVETAETVASTVVTDPRTGARVLARPANFG